MANGGGESALARLKTNISTVHVNTSLMLSRLQRFEDRLSKIDNKMGPIQQTTESYSKAKENISSTLEEVSKTYEYFRIAGEVKTIINQGYKPSTQKQFFDALGRLTYAKKFFEDHREIKSAPTVLMTIETLLRNAIMQCVAELERLLVPLGKTVHMDEDGSFQVINPMSSSTAAELKRLFALFSKHTQKVHYEVYQNIRIAQVKAELQVEEDAHAAEWAALLEDVPYIRGSHPLQGYITLAYEMLRGELQLWSNVLKPNDPECVLVFVAICDGTVMELQRLLLPMLLDDESAHSSSFIIRQANSFLIRLEMLDMFMARYEDLREICRPDMSRESTASVTLTALRNAMVEACVESINTLVRNSNDPGEPLDLTEGDFKKAAKRGDCVANANPGESCDLHPINGNVLHCCKEMVAFEPVYRRMCDLVAEIGVESFPYMYASELPDLITSLVDNLFDSLLQRADRYNIVVPPNVKPEMKTLATNLGARLLNLKVSKMYDKGQPEAHLGLAGARRHLFLANNMYSLFVYCRDMKREHLMALESDPNAALVVLNGLDSFLDSVEAQLVAAQQGFVSVVAGALGLLPANMEEFVRMHEAKQQDKKATERILKAKFSAFNAGMEALLVQQGEWRISSPELRKHLTAQLVDKICPVWINFYNTYSAHKFSKKHMVQYLKFPPHDVSQIVGHFFG